MNDSLLTSENPGRIRILDGFRCIAILSVVFYHYYVRFYAHETGIDFYPYEPEFFFRYGFFGVQLFFVISGFVIYQTLLKTRSFGEFILRRGIRLFPSLFVCSVLIYLIVEIADSPLRFPIFHSDTFLNFLPSLTTITPYFWNFIFRQDKIEYVDGVYWSLWAEVVFYISAGFVFFLSRKRFPETWLLLTVALQGVRILTSPRLENVFPGSVDDLFSGVYHTFFALSLNQWVYFSLGIFFFSLYLRHKPSLLQQVCIIALVALELFFLKEVALKCFLVGLIGLFTVFVYRPVWLRFLEWRILVLIGLVSYPLYLIHQNAGIILINRMSELVEGTFIVDFLPVIMTAIFVGLSYIIFTFWEIPWIRTLRSQFLVLNKYRSHGTP